jgi:hypothetical protein
MAENDGLVQKLLDERVKGRSYVEIGNKHGIPPEEVHALVREALSSHTITDPLEFRTLVQLRIEKVIENMWTGLEKGEWKQAEVILKAVERLQELYDLNEQRMTTDRHELSAREVQIILTVMEQQSERLFEWVTSLPLGKKANQLVLESWSEQAAEVATGVIEEVVYAEVEE